MGGCCTGSGRDGSLDQKEDKLENPSLKKGDEEIAENAGKGDGTTKMNDGPDDIKFREVARNIKSSGENINVASVHNRISNLLKSSASLNTTQTKKMVSQEY